MEELWWNDKGKLMTHAPSTYKIPDRERCAGRFNVRIYESGINAEDSIHRSKAVGEPPLMLGTLGVPCAFATQSPLTDRQLAVAEARRAGDRRKRILAPVEESSSAVRARRPP